MQGVIHVKVSIYLESDVSEKDAKEIVNELEETILTNYTMTHPMISHTEIKEISG